MQMPIRPHESLCHTSSNTWNNSLQPSPDRGWDQLSGKLHSHEVASVLLSALLSRAALTAHAGVTPENQQLLHSFIHSLTVHHCLPLLHSCALIIFPQKMTGCTCTTKDIAQLLLFPCVAMPFLTAHICDK